MNNPRAPLDEVLDAVMREEETPAYEVLKRWAARYPEFGDELASFFATWAVMMHEADAAGVDNVDNAGERGLASRIVSYAMGKIHAQQSTSDDAVSSPGPVRLLSYARSLGLSPLELAARTRLDEDIVVKLDLRRLTGVPDLCLALIQSAVGPVKSSLRLMLTGPPVLAVGASHKARQRPVPVTEDFLAAVGRSSLSEEGKEFWKAVVAAERLGKAADERLD